MKLVAIALLTLVAACGNGQPMSAEDKALAVMLFAKPSYVPYQPVPFYEMHTAAPGLVLRGY
jgi:hypothetical protein